MNNLNLESILLFLKNNYFYFLIGFLLLAVIFGSYFVYKTNERNKIYASQEVYEEFLEEIRARFDALTIRSFSSDILGTFDCFLEEIFNDLLG